MKKIIGIVIFFSMCCWFEVFGKRIVLDSDTKSARPRRAVDTMPQPYTQNICEQYSDKGCGVCNPCCGDKEGYPETICCNKNRVKSEYFRFGPYTYPYIYNQPGFYFGVGIPRAHYW